MEAGELGVYVHIPFCVRKCNYCAFNSKVGGAAEMAAYVDALIDEIKMRAGGNVGTIYFGGGTPTLLPIRQLGKILRAIHENFEVEAGAEITIEANPCTVDENYLRALRDGGFNRLSLGVQSFNDGLLKILGRVHDSKTAFDTIKTAEKFFGNVSVDLMYGLPNQTLADVERAVRTAAALEVQHVSIYGLEIEPDTNFGRLFDAGKLILPDDGAMYDFIVDELPRLGYRRYEISNFAQIGFESRHNLGYWTDKKYLGFGAGAHSYDGKIRASNVQSAAAYINKIRTGETFSTVEEIVSRSAGMEEFCFLGLRTAEGVSAAKFADKFNENIFEVYGAVIAKNIGLGLLENSGGRVFLTKRGMKFGNVVFADFLL